MKKEYEEFLENTRTMVSPEDSLEVCNMKLGVALIIGLIHIADELNEIANELRELRFANIHE